MFEPVGSSAFEVCDALPDRRSVTDGGFEADAEVSGSALMLRWKYQIATPAATSKTIDVATITNRPVRFRTGASSPATPGADGPVAMVPLAAAGSTGGMGGLVPGG